MQKEYRVKKQCEIDEIFSKKRSKGNDKFVVYYIDSLEEHFRFAISIGKKFGDAVNRNQCKRRIREIIYKQRDLIKSKKFIIVVKKEAAECPFVEMEKKITELLVASKIMNEE